MVPVKEPLLDHVQFSHPSLGEISILCSYEKLTRVCKFCAQIGHEMAACPDHQRLTVLLQNQPPDSNRDDSKILSPNIGSWINNPALIPRKNPFFPRSGPSLGQKIAHSQNSSPISGHQPGANLGILSNDFSLSPTSSDDSQNLVKRPRPAGPIPPDQFI